MAERSKTSRIIRQPSSPCVGRERELRRLEKRFAEAARSGEWMVLVQGPAGVGKTRLLEEFRGRMRLEGTVVLEGRCSPGMRALAPLGQILEQAVDFLEQVGRAGDVDLSRFAALLGEARPELATPRGLHPLEARRRLFDAYYRLLGDISRIKPVAVIVHDVHWADPATVELLSRLADGAALSVDGTAREQGISGLVVASARSGDEPEAVRALALHPRVEVIPLAGFDREGLAAYLASEHVVDRLLEATGGVPEQLEELLSEAGNLSARAPRRRLESVEPPARLALAALSALGQPSEASLVARAADMKSPARVLAALIDEGLVGKSIQGREIVLSLARPRYGDLAYGWLDEAERRRLHGRIAGLLSGARGLEAQQLAYHAIMAGDAELALPATLEAASTLELNFAFEAAAELLELAAPLAAGPTRTELDARLARIHDYLGDYQLALEHALAVAGARPDDRGAQLAVARLRALSGQTDEAARALDELAGTKLGPPEAGLEAQVALAKAEVLRSRGREQLADGALAAARATFEELLALGRRHELDDVASSALSRLGLVQLRRGELGEAEASFEEALALARKVGSPRLAAVALESLSSVAYRRGDYGKALESCQGAVSELKRYGDRALLVRAATNLAALYLGLGLADRATSLVAFADRRSAESEASAELLALKGRLALARGDRGEARRQLTRARELARAEGLRAVEVELALARLELRDGRLGEARKRVAELQAEGGLFQAELGEAAMLEAEIEEAASGESLRPALLAVEHFERARDLEGAWRAQLRVAVLLRQKGDEEGYLGHLARCSSLESELASTLPTALVSELAADEDRLHLRKALAGADPASPAREDAAERPAVLRPTPRAAEGGRAEPPTPELGIVWKSVAMGRALDLVRRLAPTDSLVLVRGESGTGKELVARAIHELGPRRSGPLVTVNCGAFVETLLLSELFGHEKGAFTGALRRREGRFEAADGGTLFLDEIGDISSATQVALLRVLQEQRFERVGGSRPIRTDARVICATNRDLESLVASGLFRKDLYYRLKGIEIWVPPLRDRREDVEPLARHFLARACLEHGMERLELSPDAMAALAAHDWPGNVRELENVIRTVVTFVDGAVITAGDLRRHARLGPGGPPERPSPPPASGEPGEPGRPIDAVSRQILETELSLGEAKKLLEREVAQEALNRTGGNITRAAALLGLTRPRLSQLIKELRLKKD